MYNEIIIAMGYLSTNITSKLIKQNVNYRK